MSRLGRKPIDLPDKVKVTVSGQTVSAEGPAGKHSVTMHAEISAKVEGGKQVIISAKGKSQMQKALWGTWRSHVANLIEGVSKGYEKNLEISGVATNIPSAECPTGPNNCKPGVVVAISRSF